MKLLILATITLLGFTAQAEKPLIQCIPSDKSVIAFILVAADNCAYPSPDQPCGEVIDIHNFKWINGEWKRAGRVHGFPSGAYIVPAKPSFSYNYEEGIMRIKVEMSGNQSLVDINLPFAGAVTHGPQTFYSCSLL